MTTVSQNQVVVETEDEQDNLLRLPYFVSVEQLSADDVLHLLQRAQYFKNGGEVPALSRPIFCTNMFFENSTRTHTSFEVAERRLGLTVIPFDPSHSSVNKGENLYDTELTMASLGIELSVIRHPENAYYNEIIRPKEGQHLQMGLVNAGDGSGQHPSQSMLDMMTIYNEFGSRQGLAEGYAMRLADRLVDAVDEAIKATGASGAADMGKLMAVLKPQLAGKADMAEVSKLVKLRLSN